MRRLRMYVLIALCLPTMVWAGGFQLNESGVKAVGMGGAFCSGYGGDATTLFYNPAGMTQLSNGLHLSAGLANISPGAKFFHNETQTTTELEPWSFQIPNFYAVYNMKDMHLAFGVGVFVPFGLGTQWADNWVGRYIAVKTYLQTISINPNVAYSLLDDKLTLSAGINYTMGNVELKQKVPISIGNEGEMNMKGDGNTISWNAALSYLITPKMRLGASYRSNIKLDMNGDATFTFNPPLPTLFADGPGGATINLPYDLRTGLSYEVDNNLRLELGFQMVGWSSYDTLAINFNRGPGHPFKDSAGVKVDSAGSVKNPRMYKDSWILRFGADYKISDDFSARAGVNYDPAPVDAKYTQPFLPDADRLGFTLGVSYNITKQFTVDAAYFYVNGADRVVKGEAREAGEPTTSNNFDGTYKAWANIMAIGLNFSF